MMTLLKHSAFYRLIALCVFAPLLDGCSSSGSISHLEGDRKTVVVKALSQLGKPYSYGGSSPNSGFDCSGLVQYSHNNAGIRVPRSTLDQKRQSKKVSRRNLEPGDLVFFKTGRKQYHVGIMVDGKRFVHAPSSGGSVMKSSLKENYWKNRYIGAGSYLN